MEWQQRPIGNFFDEVGKKRSGFGATGEIGVGAWFWFQVRMLGASLGVGNFLLWLFTRA